MAELWLGNRQLTSVFELLGANENDLTFSVGWALAKCPSFLAAFVTDVLPQVRPTDPVVRLQEATKRGGGFTDIEIHDASYHLIVEAKRGWVLAAKWQLEKYHPRFDGDSAREQLLVSLSEYRSETAELKLPGSVAGTRVIHRSWQDIHSLVVQCRPSRHAERRLLDELKRYLRGVIQMQDQRSNMVYVVSLKTTPQDWCLISPAELVERKRQYFHPVGDGYPKEPPNYIWLGQGTDLKVVQEALGHATISVTADVYGHLLPQLQKDAARRMDQALRGAV